MRVANKAEKKHNTPLARRSAGDRGRSESRERNKARRDARAAAGLCPACGGERETDRFVLCGSCREKQRIRQRRMIDKGVNMSPKQNRGRGWKDRTPGVDHPNTTTGFHYQVKSTGSVGQVVPCPCDDPLILRFADGELVFLFLREIEVTSLPVTEMKKPVVGRDYPTRKLVEKMLKIRRYLIKRGSPVSREHIDKAVVFDAGYALVDSPGRNNRWSLEGLGIAERVPGDGVWVKWQLTELGKYKGDSILKGLRAP